MAEYVTKEQVIDWYRPYGQTDEPIPFETLVSDLRDMKAADVALVRHAKVIDKIYDDHETIKQPWDYRYYCSACKIPMRDSWNKYCPSCGAKMDLEG